METITNTFKDKFKILGEATRVKQSYNFIPSKTIALNLRVFAHTLKHMVSNVYSNAIHVRAIVKFTVVNNV